MSDIIPADTAPLTSLIERAASDPSFDVAKFEVLVRLQMEVHDKQARAAFNRAMAAAQAEMLPVIRDAINPHLRNRYATLHAIDAEMRPVYTRHGFSVRFGSEPAPREGDIRITITVAHADGYYEVNHLDCPISQMGAAGGRTQMTPVQSVGAAVTYLRRYLLTMSFHIVLADDGDDDGESMRRAAATAMQRPARIAERAPAYEAPQDETPRPRTRRDFLDALAIALRDCQSAEEADKIICGEEVMRAKENFRNGHKAELDKLIADTLQRWWPQPPDEVPDVEIAGEAKVGAG